MYLTRFDALQNLRGLETQPNLVMRVISPDIQESQTMTTSLGIFTVFRGLELHKVKPARFAVTPERYLILNEGAEHQQILEPNTDLLAVRFRTGLGTDVHTAMVAWDEQQLDDPRFRLATPEFFERTYARDARLSYLMGILLAFMFENVSQDTLEQAIQPVLVKLLALHRNLETEVARLPAAKPSTRNELYRRLHVARDYIEATYLEPLSLGSIADVVNLSPHHFLRLFKAVFQTTPYQMVVGKRLEYAQKMLKTTNRDVTDICFDLGFESLGSFSRDFKRRFGLSPSQMRLQV